MKPETEFSAPALRHTITLAVSYVLAAAALIGTLCLHLLPALFAGMLVYVLIQSATPLLGKNLPGDRAKLAATVILSVVVVGLVGLFTLWLVSSLHGNGPGINALWQKIAETIEGANALLPPWMLEHLPRTAPAVKEEVVLWLREHSPELRLIGKETGVAFAHVLIGMICGALVAVHEMQTEGGQKPLASQLMARIQSFHGAFRNVVLAQAKISLINSVLTAAYLMVILPAAGIHLPFAKTIVVVTALTGMLPVVGNLISNTIIVVLSASVSFGAALSSLIFLICLHKAEYFLNARIVGDQINAKAWELLLAMLVMEAAFGLPGIASAPVFYAYLKGELADAKQI